MPATRGNKAPYARKQGRIVLFYPTVEQSFVMVENESTMRLTEIRGDAKGRYSFGETVLPVPQPDWIEVGVANQMDLLFRHDFRTRWGEVGVSGTYSTRGAIRLQAGY